MIEAEKHATSELPINGRSDGSSGFLRMCRRRKGWLVVPAIVCGAGSLIVLTLSTPLYVADAVVALESRKVQVVDIDSVVSRISQESAAIRTELDIVSSYSIAARVADQLLAEKPAESWGIMARPPSDIAWGMADRLMVATRDALASVGIAISPEWAAPAPARHAVSREEFVEAVRSGLRVSNDSRSLTILISFRSADPAVAARIANAFADAYLDEQVKAKNKTTHEAANWLAGRLTELRAALETSEQALFTYQRSAGLFEAKGSTLKAQQVNELNTQLVLAQARRIGTEGRLRAARLLRQRGDLVESLSDVLQSSTIQHLRADESIARKRLAEVRDTGGPQDLKLAPLQSNVEALRRQIVAETDRIIASLASEVDIALQMERDLETAVRDMEVQYGEMSKGFVRLNQLQREAEANRTIYESFLTRYKQALEQQDLAAPDARLVSQAIPPRDRSGPPRFPVVALATLAGLGLGFGAVNVVERLDKRPRSIGDLEAATGVPVFGLIPEAVRPARGGHSVCNPDPAREDALERAFSTLILRRKDRPTRSIVVSSALPGEGRTSFCVSLARSLARSGRKVLVVDANLRAPRVARAFGAPFTVGIQDVLSRSATLDEAIRRDAVSGARFIGAHVGAVGQRTLLSSPRFASMIDVATQVFDIVLIDTPAVLTATDAAVVAGVADARLLYVRWGRTTVPTIWSALRTLALCGVTVDGIVAGGVETGREQDAAEASWGAVALPNPGEFPSRA